MWLTAFHIMQGRSLWANNKDCVNISSIADYSTLHCREAFSASLLNALFPQLVISFSEILLPDTFYMR